MNTEDLRLLADRAETVLGRPEQRLGQVHARIRTARRRRLAGAVAGATAGLVAVVIGIAVLVGPAGLTKDHTPRPPANTTTPTPVPVNPSPARALVYSDDPLADFQARLVRTVQLGERAVRIDQPLGRYWDLHITDAGVVYDKGDGGVWFTDGGPPRRIAARSCDAIVTGNTGSLATWFDCAPGQQGTLVVFDTGTGRQLTRMDIPSCRPAFTCGPDAIIGDHVYFTDQNGAGNNTRLSRLDVTTGRVAVVTRQMQAGDLRSQPRALVVGDSSKTGTPDDKPTFDVVGSRLVPIDLQRDARRTRAFVAAVGRPVQLLLPTGYHPVPAPTFRGLKVVGHVTRFTLFEWLDDDTVALAQEGDSLHGDILTCHLPDGRCQLTVTGHIPADWHAPDPVRLLPGASGHLG